MKEYLNVSWEKDAEFVMKRFAEWSGINCNDGHDLTILMEILKQNKTTEPSIFVITGTSCSSFLYFAEVKTTILKLKKSNGKFQLDERIAVMIRFVRLNWWMNHRVKCCMVYFTTPPPLPLFLFFHLLLEHLIYHNLMSIANTTSLEIL